MAFHKKTLLPYLEFAKMNSFPAVDTLPKSSFVFVTYNRCPNKEFLTNPFVWAIQTLTANKGYALDEIIVIDDCSDDYTTACVNWLKINYNLRIVYHKNVVHKDLSYSRNIGLGVARNKLVFMGDDDCLFSENFLLGGILTFHLLNQRVQNIALINLNVYEKATYPRKAIPANEIGKTDFNNAYFVQNFNSFPQEFISNPNWLSKDLNLLNPIPVGVFRGVNICDKELLARAGGYPDLSMWKFGYSEHLELSRRLQDCGYQIFHQADPKIFAIHLHYGGISNDSYDRRCSRTFIKGPNLLLGNMIRLSEVTNHNTGTRSSTHDFHFTEIGTLFSFYLKISVELGIHFAVREYDFFVNRNHVFSTTPNHRIKARFERENIWTKAIKAGIVATEKQTGQKYPAILERIMKDIQSSELKPIS
jgi:glycosyltransferase involved in cell wall biosynthesis